MRNFSPVRNKADNSMNVIQRNFFNLLQSGALNQFHPLEPMSLFKWNRLLLITQIQDVSPIVLRGMKNHQFDNNAPLPARVIQSLENITADRQEHDAGMTGNSVPQLSNLLFKRRLRKIQQNERHTIDASLISVELLNIIVQNVNHILKRGIPLSGILQLGQFLRTRGDKVDFVKIDTWLEQLHLTRFAQLEGSFLVTMFSFTPDEIPFLHQVEPSAEKLALMELSNFATTNTQETNWQQTQMGFIYNNSTTLRHTLRRTLRYLPFAPIETTSHLIGNFARTLSEIEE